MASAKRFEDLICWQLSEQLKELVFKLTARPPADRDRRFCAQIQDSARSAPANIAEGFGWYEPKPNARHVSIAKGSLEETKNHVYDGFKRSHFDAAERDDLLKLNQRALNATRRYLRYLRSCKQAPSGPRYEPRHENENNRNNENRNDENRNDGNRNDGNPNDRNEERPER